MLLHLMTTTTTMIIDIEPLKESKKVGDYLKIPNRRNEIMQMIIDSKDIKMYKRYKKLLNSNERKYVKNKIIALGEAM